MRRVGVVALLAGVTLVAASSASASGRVKQVGGQRALAVSVPSEPVRVEAGTRVRTLIRVVNPNHEPVSVVVRSRGLSLGDDGKVTIGARPDGRWASRVRFPAGVIRIPAEGWRDIRLSVRAPPHLQPDLYFIGFLVTPVDAGAGSIKVVNQIGSFLTIDVPGPRLRRLAGRIDLPGFVLGSHAAGSVRLTNTGHASVTFWGEADTTLSPGGSFRQDRLDLSLLPVGRSRSISVTGKPRWPIGIVTVTARVTYPGRTEAETRQLVFMRRVVVVSPWVPAGLGALAAGVAAAWFGRRRRRRSRGALKPVLHGG